MPTTEYYRQQALELLDGAIKNEGLIVVGATNRPDHIDEAIKRSGRLETHIEIPRPTCRRWPKSWPTISVTM